MYENDNYERLISATSQERLLRLKILEARLLSTDARLKEFAQTKERLIAEGTDPATAYQSLLAGRDKVLKRLQELREAERRDRQTPADDPSDPPLPGWRANESPLELPIAPLHLRQNTFLFGTSGFVQMPRAVEGVSITPNHADATGEITTTRLRTRGGVEFSGTLVAPHEVEPDDPFGQRTYEWLHNWKYVVPFPAAASRSLLRYRFDVAVNLSVSREHQPVDFLSFVSLGEEPNLNLNSSIDVDIDAGWPLVADLTVPEPNTNYNGYYGWRIGRLTVQRSFYVSGGSIPAIAVIVGVAAVLGHRAHCDFRFAGPASTTPQSADGGVEGRISYNMVPLEVAVLD